MSARVGLQLQLIGNDTMVREVVPTHSLAPLGKESAMDQRIVNAPGIPGVSIGQRARQVFVQAPGLTSCKNGSDRSVVDGAIEIPQQYKGATKQTDRVHNLLKDLTSPAEVPRLSIHRDDQQGALGVLTKTLNKTGRKSSRACWDTQVDRLHRTPRKKSRPVPMVGRITRTHDTVVTLGPPRSDKARSRRFVDINLLQSN